MANYFLSKEAINDLKDIWEYTCNEWSENQADRYYNLLLESCEELASNPSYGKRYDIVTENLLGYKSGRHIIFYLMVSAGDIEIIRILHDMMDLKGKI